MDRDNTIARLENIAKHAVHTAGEDIFILSLDDGLAIHEAIEALKAQLSSEDATSDLISRQAAIDAIVQCTNCEDEDTLREYVLKHSLDNGWTGGILEALDTVKDLPPAQPEVLACGNGELVAQPEPHEGYWIDKGWDGDWAWQIDGRGNCWRVIECSECGKGVSVESNYCPHCGAKMRGERQK